jgi:type I restriction enzyme M protein
LPKEKFITKYSTANSNNGSGLGGYDINRIIDYFNGTWDLILNENDIYPVRFRIQFPIKPII